jgi:tetratricopeptide (TPR) repeat protein
MPEPKRPLKVFLCHAHADRDAVRALYTRLTKDGVDAWLDKEKLLPGQDWELEIRKAVREVDLVIVCLSKQFNQAGFRQKEVRLAIETAMEKPEGEIFIVPARLEECDTLESLRRWHWVDLFEASGYEKLTQTLSLRSEKVGANLATRKSVELDFSKLTEYHPDGQVGILNNLGLTSMKMDNLSGAINYYLQALVLAQEINDIKSQSVIFSNLGSVYWRMKDFQKAKEYFERSLSLSHELGDRMAEASVLTNLAFVYANVGDLVRSIELYRHALSINREIGM